MSTTITPTTISDLNLIAHFLADPPPNALETLSNIDTIVICASAVLHGASTIFQALQNHSLTAKNLVLCGGIGHSTKLIWDAISNHPIYHPLTNELHGLPEARVLELLLHRFFDVERIKGTGCRILTEDRSTNCGSNARETRTVLEAANVDHGASSQQRQQQQQVGKKEKRNTSSAPETFMIVQDPTMCLRTTAAFKRVYDDDQHAPEFFSLPCFIPQVRRSANREADDVGDVTSAISGIEYAVPNVPAFQLWGMHRFVELVMGEIPRLRDDEEGYGPNGKGFIVHVDIPDQVEEAWTRLYETFKTTR